MLKGKELVMDIVAVDISKMRIFDYLREGQTEEGLLNQANEYKKERIESWNRNYFNRPCEEFGQYLKEAKEVEYQIMTYEEYKTKLYSKTCGKWTEITEQRYNDMLDALPPLRWTNGGFFFKEFYIEDITWFFQQWRGKYYNSYQSINRPRQEIINELQRCITEESIEMEGEYD